MACLMSHSSLCLLHDEIFNFEIHINFMIFFHFQAVFEIVSKINNSHYKLQVNLAITEWVIYST